ncbi:cytochrome P450 [Actibacterium sp. D379-3]
MLERQEDLDQGPVSVTVTEDREPWDYYDQLRVRGPLVWDEVMGGWIVLSYEHCAQIEMNETLFRNPYQDVPQVIIDIKGGGRNITVLGGEEHRRMRHFFMKLLTPQLVAGYREKQVVPVIDMLMDRILAKGTGRADLTRDFGDQIPPRVIAALLGMPWQDDALVARILHLHEEIMEVIGSGFRTEELRQKGLRVSAEINEMLLPYIRARRDNPQDDLISRVWTEAPSDYGDDLTEADAVAICRELFLGGADTTVHGIANLLYLTLTDDAVRAALTTDRDAALPVAVEEAMRLYGSVMYRFRIANEATEIAGQQIKAGDRMILLHSAANRDPVKYACPHAADLSRRPANDHLAFNKGPRNVRFDI